MRDSCQDILRFWFEETDPVQWFRVDESFDALIKERFLLLYKLAVDGLCDSWRQNAQGCLALCLLLDQFPRNMFRGHAQAFATDQDALEISRYALAQGFDQLLPPGQRRFLYLPFEHSESLADQKKAVALFETMEKDDPVGLDYARRHLQVIEKFGRFPHRNAILGRKNTPAEEEYLAQPGAGF